MKIIKTITILIIALTLTNFEARSQNSEQKILQDSIKSLLKTFANAANLFDLESVSEPYPSFFPPNEKGIELFYSLSDTLSGVPKIINYIDPEVGEFLKRVIINKVDLSEFSDSIQDKRLFISPKEYVSNLKKIYPDDGPGRGTGCKVDTSNINILYDTKRKLHGKVFKIYAYVPVSFSGFITAQDGSSKLYSFNNQELFFELNYNRIKSHGVVQCTDFRIKEIRVFNEEWIPDTLNLFTVEPFFSTGIVTGNQQLNEDLKDNISLQNGYSLNAGFNISKKVKSFKSDSTILEFGAGAGFLIYKSKASIMNYEKIEQYSGQADEIPYDAENLQKYTYSIFGNHIEQELNLNYMVIPVFTKLHFRLFKSEKLSGYVRTGLDFYLPLSSRTSQTGNIEYIGEFLYSIGNYNVKIRTDNIQDDHELNLLIEDFDNLYGEQPAVTKSEFESNFGINWKNEAGIRLSKENMGLNFGIFMSNNISGISNSDNNPLISKYGEANPVLSKLNKILPVTLGFNLSIDLDINKIKLIPVSKKLN